MELFQIMSLNQVDQAPKDHLMAKHKTHYEDCDVLVVGGGMAGTGATFEARHWGRDILGGEFYRVVATLSLWEIAVDNGQGGTIHRETTADKPPLRLFTVPGKTAANILRCLSRHQRYPIMGLLSVEVHVVTHGFHFGNRELVVIHLGFLQADNVRV